VKVLPGDQIVGNFQDPLRPRLDESGLANDAAPASRWHSKSPNERCKHPPQTIVTGIYAPSLMEVKELACESLVIHLPCNILGGLVTEPLAKPG
jgi:hypothetical protein